MRLTSTGLGIGTSSPTAKLGVAGNAAFAGSNGPSGNSQGVRILTTNTSGDGVTIDSYAFGSNGYGPLYLNTGNAGTPVMTLTVAGNVGIGTSSPQHKIDAIGNIRSANSTNTAGQSANIFAATFNSNFGQTDSATFQSVLNNATTGENDLFIKQFNHNSGSTDDIVLKAASGNSGYTALYTADTERMRIDSAGNVGIGTSSPGVKLHVNSGATAEVLRIEATTNPLFSMFNAGAREFYIQTQSVIDVWGQANKDMRFGTNDAERMRITSAGNVGIGTTSPAAKLDIIGPSAASSPYLSKAIQFAPSNYPTRTWSLNYDDGGASGNGFNISAASTKILYLNADGNVGIGTSSPNARLDVASSSGSAGQVNTHVMLTRGTSIGAYLATERAAATNDVSALIFGVNSAERARIDSSGNVGIGGPVDNHGGYGRCLQISGIEAALELESSSGYSYVAQNAVDLQIRNVANGDMLFYTNNAERLRIDSSGNLLVNTTSAYGGTKLVVSSDTTTANPMAVMNTRSTASTDYSIIFNRNGSIVGSVQTSLSATVYVTSSDYRLKEDWVAVADAATRVNALKPVNFAWKVDGSRVDGFLAHEVAEVVPEAVVGEKDAVDAEGKPVYQGIDQSKLVPLLTAALQEALAKIESLTARVSALEGN
jgi:hypothetical protein